MALHIFPCFIFVLVLLPSILAFPLLHYPFTNVSRCASIYAPTIVHLETIQ